MNNQYYSETDAALLARRRHVQEMVGMINGPTDFVLRGRADEGKGIQELHLDFETKRYNVWIAFRRSGHVYIQRDQKGEYKRERFSGYSVPAYEKLQDILNT